MEVACWILTRSAPLRTARTALLILALTATDTSTAARAGAGPVRSNWFEELQARVPTGR